MVAATVSWGDMMPFIQIYQPMFDMCVQIEIDGATAANAPKGAVVTQELDPNLPLRPRRLSDWPEFNEPLIWDCGRENGHA